VHQVGKQNYILLRCTVNSTLKFKKKMSPWRTLFPHTIIQVGHTATMKRCKTWFTTRNSLLQNFKRNYHMQRSLPGIPVVGQTHPIQTTNPILLIWPFVLSSNHYAAAQKVQWLGYMLKGMGFNSQQMQENYLFSRTSRPAPVPTHPPPQWKPELFLWQ